MKVKELLALMEERGVECSQCQGAEKSHIVSQVLSAPVSHWHTLKERVRERRSGKEALRAAGWVLSTRQRLHL